MTISSVDVIMGRIHTAMYDSPIAVFKSKGKLDAVFAATAKTQNRIKSGDVNLIGVYNGTMKQKDIRDTLLELVS